MSKRSCECCRYLTDGCHCKARDERITSSTWFDGGCPHFEKRQQTVFDHITQSEEKLAEKFVYFDCDACDDNGIGYPWCSTLFADGGHFETEDKAIAATIKELKKEFNNE